MDRIIYFHRNIKAGYSINKVTQTIVRNIPNKEEYFVPAFGGSPWVLLRNYLYVWRRRDKKAINHVTGDIHYCILALIGCKSVLTIHDTVPVDYVKKSVVKRKLIEWIWFRLPIRYATKVVCISDFTKQSIMKFTKRKDIEVIHNAVDPALIRSTRLIEIRKVPNVLIIGTSSNKNLTNTFEALNGLACRVTIIGRLNETQIASLAKNRIAYETKEGLTDAQICSEYEKCDIVSFITLFEGFGMIVAEANKVGRPVICSNISVMKEVGNDAVFYVNPMDIKSMKLGFIELFNNLKLQKALVERGYRNSERFDAQKILKKWEYLYSAISDSQSTLV